MIHKCPVIGAPIFLKKFLVGSVYFIPMSLKRYNKYKKIEGMHLWILKMK
jgi:hypothetical protein